MEEQLDFEFNKSDKSRERAIIYIDQNNIFFRYRKLNWKNLLKYLESKYDIVRITSYNSIDTENQKQLAFVTYLGANGYRCKITDVKHSTNVDVQITTDLIRDSLVNTTYDTIVLISSDNDYAYCLNDASNRGFKISVIGCRGLTGQELIKISDTIEYLESIPLLELEK